MAVQKQRANQIFPVKDTSIEIKMQRLLEFENITYEKHKVLKMLNMPKDVRYHQFDIVIPDKKIIIECDGDYWHGPNFPNMVSRDKKITEHIRHNTDWLIMRFWEKDINNNLPSVRQIILNKLGV